jgi:superfamily II DNA helicase RecQ
MQAVSRLIKEHPNIPVMALTATANQESKLHISATLCMNNPVFIEGSSFYRDNFSYLFAGML